MNNKGMSYVYLLSFYDEHGSEAVKATLDRSKLHAMIDSYFEGQTDKRADYHAKLDKLLRDGDESLSAPDDGEFTSPEKGAMPHNLGSGWGGMQLHVVRLE